MIKLHRIAIGPYKADFSVYAPSQLHPPKHITQAEFTERYADHGLAMRVSLDGVSEPVLTTVYMRGLFPYIIEPEER